MKLLSKLYFVYSICSILFQTAYAKLLMTLKGDWVTTMKLRSSPDSAVPHRKRKDWRRWKFGGGYQIRYCCLYINHMWRIAEIFLNILFSWSFCYQYQPRRCLTLPFLLPFGMTSGLYQAEKQPNNEELSELRMFSVFQVVFCVHEPTEWLNSNLSFCCL